MSRQKEKSADGSVKPPDTSAPALKAAVERELDRLAAAPLAPALYLVATPIGNLSDITLRALHVLASADVVYCEDTRHSARLLQHFSIAAETRAFHEHNEEAESVRVLAALEAGKRIALISDAGMPLISDPGFKLVRACAERGLAVTCVPGPSALLTALSTSGLATDQFFFAGFLPPRETARRTRLADLKTVSGTLVFYEAPQRTAEMLTDASAVLGARNAVVARELTKLHEEIARGSLAALAAEFSTRDVKGEVVVVIGPAPDEPVRDAEIEVRLAAALETMRLKDAAAAVADALGVPKSRVYDLGLRSKKQRGDDRGEA